MMIKFQIIIHFIIIIIIIIIINSKRYNTLCKTTQCETHFKACVFSSRTIANSNNSKFDQHLSDNEHAVGPTKNITYFCILCSGLKSIISLEVKLCTHSNLFNDLSSVALNQTYQHKLKCSKWAYNV